MRQEEFDALKEGDRVLFLPWGTGAKVISHNPWQPARRRPAAREDQARLRRDDLP